MSFPTVRFDDNINKGVNANAPDMTPAMLLDMGSYNLTQGINQGLGPRYTIAPIPGHNVYDAPGDAFGNPIPQGLRQSEGTSLLAVLDDRIRFYGMAPISLWDYTNKVYKTYYVWLLSTKPADHYLWVGLSSNGATVFVPQPDYTYGFHDVNWNAAGNYNHPSINHLQTLLGDPSGSLQRFLKLSAAATYPQKHVSFSIFSSPSKNIPMPWVVGKKHTDGAAGYTASMNCIAKITASTNSNTGVPSDINTRKFRKTIRQMEFQNIAAVVGAGSPGLQLKYQYRDVAQTDLDSMFNGTYNQSTTTETIEKPAAYGGLTTRARLDAAAAQHADVSCVLLKDDDMFTNSEYSAVLLPLETPMACLFQSWNANANGTLNQWFDLTAPRISPRTLNTSSGAYTEDGIYKKTCWNRWPVFARGTGVAIDSASNYDGQIHVTLGAAGSGILAKETVYEFAYSIYDKQIDYETNVGVPAKIQTKAADNVAITLLRDQRDPVGGTIAQRLQYCGAINTFAAYLPFTLSDATDPFSANYLEFRIYYRQEGTFEWLPAGKIDAAQYYFDCDLERYWICTGSLAMLPGGQPGGFIDHSPLPKDKYTSVGMFRGRNFWCSEKALIYSSKDTIFEYPLRNSVSAPTGKFRGFIQHTYPGQSEQRGRIVVFGSNGTYVGRFTGETLDVPVQISANTVGTFPLDGSDFVLDDWTSDTAFSHRSAVVAEGILYFWGPRGVFRDDGVATPTKISQDLSPDIETLYDPNKTDEIHCTYNGKTKEIIWFYAPRDTTVTVTYGLTYNIQTGAFLPQRFPCQIDSAFQADLSSDTTSRKTNGLRTIISARQNSTTEIQRGYFFDERDRAGDIYPTTELMCKQVSTPAAGTRRFTLDSGYDAANFATIIAGDLLLIQQGSDYSNDSTVLDLVAAVTAKGAGTLDIALPTGSSAFQGAATYTFDKNFPIYISRLNQMPYVLKTRYWCPGGVANWYFWQWFHFIFKVKLLFGTEPTVNWQYRTPISKQLVTNTISLTNNSDGNHQEYSPLKMDDQSAEGQSMRFLISGNYLGHEWVLQYLGADCEPLKGEFLQTFEG
jgi:hypothetical protein